METSYTKPQGSWWDLVDYIIPFTIFSLFWNSSWCSLPPKAPIEWSPENGINKNLWERLDHEHKVSRDGAGGPQIPSVFGEAHKPSAQAFLGPGHIGPPAWPLLKSQMPRKKAAFLNKWHIVHINNSATLNHPHQLGSSGDTPQTHIPRCQPRASPASRPF